MKHDKEVLIKVEGLGKKFCKDFKTSLWYGVKDLWSNVFGNKLISSLRPEEFWAVKDINFELRRGECLGLIGHNGAGKSTLLKILNGLINPDEGRVMLKGKVGALIELGAGFNPILSGRENIYNNGAVLGFTRQEINDKLQNIIDFSELEEFIDMPVQNYSSGMKVRLGFAIAAQMEPDVLIIDEVLAVGDLGFILKCFKTIDNILPKTAIVFVSHNMPMVARICSQLILMDHGETVFQGQNISKGIDLYYNRFVSEDEENVVYTDESIELLEARVNNKSSVNNTHEINWGDSIVVNFKIKNRSLKKMPFIFMAVYDKEQRAIAEIYPEGQKLSEIKIGNTIEFKVQLNNIYLSKGIYYITFNASEDIGFNVYLKIHKTVTLKIDHKRQMWTSFLIDSELIEVND